MGQTSAESPTESNDEWKGSFVAGVGRDLDG